MIDVVASADDTSRKFYKKDNLQFATNIRHYFTVKIGAFYIQIINTTTNRQQYPRARICTLYSEKSGVVFDTTSSTIVLFYCLAILRPATCSKDKWKNIHFIKHYFQFNFHKFLFKNYFIQCKHSRNFFYTILRCVHKYGPSYMLMMPIFCTTYKLQSQVVLQKHNTSPHVYFACLCVCFQKMIWRQS